MVTIGMNYKVLPGKEETFENAFRKVIHAMQSIAGHTVTRMYRNIDDAREYVILSDWSDRAAFDAFIASETFRAVANWGKEQILAGRPTHNYYEH
ncbi:MAG: antibiotic biosynthesis monooxygenase [Planctomycetota bacterium]|nr:MAG: antibiotic biosynthesis monooxygenase [Planctomycetota bacterium]